MRHAVSVLLLALALPVAAQAPDRTGFSLGGRLYAVGLSVDAGGDQETDSGGGIEARAAYGFNRTVSVYLNLGGATMQPEDEDADTYVLGTADLGARFNLLPSRTLNPYLEAALTGQTAAFDVPGTDEDLEIRGGGVTVGGGLLYSFSRTVALDVGLDVTAGRFTEASFDGESTDDFDEIDSGIARLGVGLVWHP